MTRLRRAALIGVAIVMVMEVTVYLALSNVMDSVE